MLKFLVCFPLGPYTYIPLAFTPYTIEAFQFKILAPIIFSPERLFSSQILFVSLFVGSSIYPLLGNVNDTSYLTSLYFNDLPYYTQAPFFPQKYYRFPTDRTSPSHLFSWLFRHLFSPFAMRSDA